MADTPLQLIVYVSLAVPRHASTMAAVDQLAARHPGVEVEVVDVDQHPDVAEQARVLTVPSIIARRGEWTVRVVGDLTEVDTLTDILRLDVPSER